MLVNLLCFSVFAEQVPQHSHAPDPQDFGRHTSVGCTLPLSGTHVTTLAASQSILPDTSAGVDLDGLTDDQTILDQLTDSLT